MEPPRAPLLVCALALSLAALSALARTPADAESQDVFDPTAWSPPGEPEVGRDYAAPLKGVRKALRAVLKDAGLELEHTAKGEDLLTGFAFFTRKDFGNNVATPPPTIEPLYPFLQSNQQSTGHYRLRIRLTPLDEATHVAFSAQIVAAAYNMSTYEQLSMERQSDGTIERTFLDRLGQQLAPTPND